MYTAWCPAAVGGVLGGRRIASKCVLSTARHSTRTPSHSRGGNGGRPVAPVSLCYNVGRRCHVCRGLSHANDARYVSPKRGEGHIKKPNFYLIPSLIIVEPSTHSPLVVVNHFLYYPTHVCSFLLAHLLSHR